MTRNSLIKYAANTFTPLEMEAAARQISNDLNSALEKLTLDALTPKQDKPAFLLRACLIDSYMDEATLVYKILLPLLDRESFSVSIVGDTLEMRYRVKEVKTDNLSEEVLFTQKLPSGKRLSTSQSANVVYEDGVLTLNLPLDVQVIKLSL